MMKYLSLAAISFLVMASVGCGTSKSVGQAPNPTPIKPGGRPFQAEPNPQQVAGAYVDATTQLIRGDFGQAERLFQEVLQMDPSNHAAMFNLAKIYLDQRKFDQAVQYAQGALAGNEDNYWYLRVLHDAYQAKGDFTKATATLSQLVATYPDKIDDQLKLADLYSKQGKWKEAISVLDALENRMGPSEIILIRKFRIHEAVQDYDAALQVSNEMIQMEPSEAKYYQLRYQMLAEMGRQSDAVSTLETLLEYDPDNGFALLTLADYYKHQDDLTKSDEYLFRAFANPEVDPRGKVSIIEGMLEFVDEEPGLAERVQKLADILQETHPDAPSAQALSGRMLSSSGDYDSARERIRQSLDSDPTNQEAWFELLATSYTAGDFLQLYKDSEEALEYYPNKVEFLYYFGWAANQRERLDESAYALKKVVKIGSQYQSWLAEAHAQLGYAYELEGKNADADQALEQALAIDPQNAGVLATYAEVLVMRQTDLGKALDFAKTAQKSSKSPLFASTLGWVYFHQGDYEKARKWLELAANNSQNYVITERYGDLLLKVGEKDEAVKLWEKAIDQGAESLDISAKLQQ
ncbi:tetratricopeptide repeat protein [Pontibacter sp. G13]|uniref:tetratricopeptide repeat protein n=1 Tax=Pontibacter sp. G13 TaxID=3074898 RepID=UPI0028899756|nr:tetratricopeptide repeat protein [Pontibacter sp. G13]WNJ17810.1 tetratricopeptide repeat protein [Pontibacter sp. G13]